MSNAKHVKIHGRLPFNCIHPDPDTGKVNETLRDWLATMNTPTFGLHIQWTGPVESRRNRYGGKTAIYAFTIGGFEAIADTALDALLRAIADCDGEISHKEICEPA